MKHSTIKLRHAIFGICAIAAVSAAADTGIAVVAPDGTVTEFPYTALQQMRLGADGVKVITSGGEQDISYADIDRININAEIAGIDEITAAGNIAVWLSDEGATLNIAGARPDTSLAVADMAGRIVAAGRADATGASAISLASIPNGAYVLIIDNSNSVKFVRP